MRKREAGMESRGMGERERGDGGWGAGSGEEGWKGLLLAERPASQGLLPQREGMLGNVLRKQEKTTNNLP